MWKGWKLFRPAPARRRKASTPTDLAGGARKGREWLGRWHPVHYSFWPWAFFTASPWATWWSAILIVGCLWIITIGTYITIWRERRIRVLAEAGLPDPGLWGLWKQLRDSRRKLAYVRRQWVLACSTERLLGKESGTAPTLRRIVVDASGDLLCAVDCKESGLTVQKLRSAAADIAQICGAHDLIVRPTKTVGMARLHFMYSDPLDRVLDLAHMPKPAGKDVRFGMGITATGEPMSMPLNKPTLIAGLQESGKSNLIWAALESLLDQGVWILLYVIDPKGGMELSMFADKVGKGWLGRLKVAGFAANKSDGQKLIKEALGQLQMRQGRMRQAKSRKMVATSQEEPAIVVIMDEALTFADEIKKGADTPLGQYLQQGRAAMCTLWALLQTAHADQLGVGRHFFGNRIAFRLSDRFATNAILGDGSWERGAHCDAISKTQPGIGYATDDEGTLTKFRSPYVPDEMAEAIAAGGAPGHVGDQLPEEPTDWWVYRFFNADGRLLYVGETGNLKERFKEHAADKPWWSEVDQGRTFWTWAPGQLAAKREEKELIDAGMPIYNDQHNRDNPWRIDWRRKQKEIPAPQEELDLEEPLELVSGEPSWGAE